MSGRILIVEGIATNRIVLRAALEAAHLQVLCCSTIAEARAEAERLRAEAEAEANQQVGSSREIADSLLAEARAEARKVGEAEREAMEGEVNSLLARRDFLESDVDHLEQFLVDQRTRLRDAANQIVELTERVPGGLGEVRRPLLSAANDDDATQAMPVTPAMSAESAEPASSAEPVEEELWLPDVVDEATPVIDPGAGATTQH